MVTWPSTVFHKHLLFLHESVFIFIYLFIYLFYFFFLMFYCPIFYECGNPVYYIFVVVENYIFLLYNFYQKEKESSL